VLLIALAVLSLGAGRGGGPDADRDGVPSKVDNCELPGRPQVSYNPSQLDAYPVGGDGVGDACQSGVIVLRNRSSHELREYRVAASSYRDLGPLTGRTCAARTTCTFVDGTERPRTHWFAVGTDSTGSSDGPLCPGDAKVTREPVDCEEIGAYWEVDFVYTFAGLGDNATGPECRDTITYGINTCHNAYSSEFWQPQLRGPETTPPNAGPELLQTRRGVETLTATDIPEADQSPVFGPPEVQEPRLAPIPMSPLGPVRPGTYATSVLPPELSLHRDLVVVRSTAPGTTALTGVVLDDDGAVEGALVSMRAAACFGCAPVTVSTRTVDGAFAFIHLPPAAYTLDVRAAGHRPYTIANDPYRPDETYVTAVELS
jgi:hypothetical protein